MSFFPAARKSHNLLTSNFLEVASVGLIPGTLLGLVGATISMLIGWGVFAMTWVLGVPTVPKDHDGSMTMVCVTIGGVAEGECKNTPLVHTTTGLQHSPRVWPYCLYV